MLGKPTASLSSTLLARKGQAMRPQGFVSLSHSPQEDLGWNDMGEEMAPPHQPQFHIQPVAPTPAEAPVEVPAPPVLRQRAVLEEQIAPKAEAAPEPALELAPEPEAAPEPIVEAELAPQPAYAPERFPVISAGTLARVASEVTAKKSKAAFTLRLDHDRHLRLRLASAVSNLSAQQLVTQALDAFLESLTEVDALARQVADRERN
jgi:hypothetical protein